MINSINKDHPKERSFKITFRKGRPKRLGWI